MRPGCVRCAGLCRPSGRGGGGFKLEGKGKDREAEITNRKNLGRIESGGGLLLFGSLCYGDSNTINFLFYV